MVCPLGILAEEAAMPTDNDARAKLRLVNERRAREWQVELQYLTVARRASSGLPPRSSA